MFFFNYFFNFADCLFIKKLNISLLNEIYSVFSGNYMHITYYFGHIAQIRFFIYENNNRRNFKSHAASHP